MKFFSIFKVSKSIYNIFLYCHANKTISKLSLYARLNNAESNEFVPDSSGETKSAYTRLLFIDRIRILLSAWKEDEK